MINFPSGYFSKVSTMAEVKKEVLNHINVMARPWVLLGKDYHRLMWTGLSADVDVGKGYKFVTSLSRPVYNLKNYTVTHKML